MTQTQGKTSNTELCRWFATMFAVISVILLFLLLFVLSKNLEESRKVSEELLNRLENGEKERKDLRRELERSKAKLQEISRSSNTLDLRKGTRVLRNSRRQTNICNKVKKCKHDHGHHETGNHVHNFCGRVRNCSHDHKPDSIYMEWQGYQGGAATFDYQRGWMFWNIRWQRYTPKKGNTKFNIKDNGHVIVRSSGVYTVYCRLHLPSPDQNETRMPQLELMKNDEVLLSALAVSSYDGTKTVLQFQVYGQEDLATNTTLYVRVRFTFIDFSYTFQGSDKSQSNFGMRLVDLSQNNAK